MTIKQRISVLPKRCDATPPRAARRGTSVAASPGADHVANQSEIVIIRSRSDSCKVDGEDGGDVSGSFASGARQFASHHSVPPSEIIVLDNSLHQDALARDNWRARHFVTPSSTVDSVHADEEAIERALAAEYVRRSDTAESARRRRSKREEDQAPETDDERRARVSLAERESATFWREVRGRFLSYIRTPGMLDDPPNNLRELARLRGDASPLLTALRARVGNPPRALAIFCHGSPNWLQVGVRGSAGARDLAAAICHDSTTGGVTPSPHCMHVVLYACSAGAGPNEPERSHNLFVGKNTREYCGEQFDLLRQGVKPQLESADSFAAMLRDELSGIGQACTVDSHATVGHAFSNPHVRRYRSERDDQGAVVTSNEWILKPGADIANRVGAWVRELSGDLVWEYPFLTIDEIHQRLT